MSCYVSKYVVCPFYRRNDTNRICCEGVNENNTLNIVFGTKQDVLNYEKHFCDSIELHKNCLVYQMLAKKWEETR